MTGSEIFVSLAILAVCASVLEAGLALIHYATWPFAWAFRRRARRYLRPTVVVVAPRADAVPVSLDPSAHAAVESVVPTPSPMGPRVAALADAAVKPLDFAAVYRQEQEALFPSADRSPEKMAEFKAMMATDRVNADTPMLPECRCRHCIEAREGQWGLAQTFVLCPQCGNKRCPKADNHRFDCSGSNDLGQYPRIDGKPVEP